MPVLLCVDSDSEPEDTVRLWEDGWKERYYQDKFGVPSDDHEFKVQLTEQYTMGLCWVLGYYYQVNNVVGLVWRGGGGVWSGGEEGVVGVGWREGKGAFFSLA